MSNTDQRATPRATLRLEAANLAGMTAIMNPNHTNNELDLEAEEVRIMGHASANVPEETLTDHQLLKCDRALKSLTDDLGIHIDDDLIPDSYPPAQPERDPPPDADFDQRAPPKSLGESSIDDLLRDVDLGDDSGSDSDVDGADPDDAGDDSEDDAFSDDDRPLSSPLGYRAPTTQPRPSNVGPSGYPSRQLTSFAGGRRAYSDTSGSDDSDDSGNSDGSGTRGGGDRSIDARLLESGVAGMGIDVAGIHAAGAHRRRMRDMVVPGGPENPHSPRLTEEQMRRRQIDAAFAAERGETTTTFGHEREREQDIKNTKLEQIGHLRLNLDEEGVDISDLTVPSADSPMRDIDAALTILRLKNDRIRYSTLAEEIFIGAADMIESVFDGTRELPIVGYRPDYTGYSQTAKLKLHRMRTETSQVVSQFVGDHNISPTMRIALELLPSFLLYPRLQRKHRGAPGIQADLRPNNMYRNSSSAAMAAIHGQNQY